jgi:hypothetical protein
LWDKFKYQLPECFSGSRHGRRTTVTAEKKKKEKKKLLNSKLLRLVRIAGFSFDLNIFLHDAAVKIALLSRQCSSNNKNKATSS